ncbi:MAG: citramalate synthase [Chloroflexi bacterium]|nr:citramalate synthase [Chloroflexota bacterium]
MIKLYDTTLRDGAQGHGISFSVADKLKICRKLDEIGLHYIEGGWPDSNPKDAEFFKQARGLKLASATLVAFGSTRRAGTRADNDGNLRALLGAGAPAATIVGKAWDFHVTRVLETTLEENLAMIADSVRFLKSRGLTVFFDAEHFFDGFKRNRDYALQALKTAGEAGADGLVLCDTNGGSLPFEVHDVVSSLVTVVTVPLGIHAHNDGELAVANSLSAVRAGVQQVQGTVNGYGERCGNANLCSIIPNLTLKMGVESLDNQKIQKLAELSRYVAELANRAPNPFQPFVGACAFAHKAGLHVSGILKHEDSYQHIDPALVGNVKDVLVSEVSGASNIIYKAREKGMLGDLNKADARRIADQIKKLESQGFQYDSAEASFELLVRRNQDGYQPPFELVDFMVVVERHRRPATRNGEDMLAEATVKVKVGDEIIHTAAGGNGPVSALDGALRKALLQFYPKLAAVKLVDYKVRILEESEGTAAQVRVLIESTDGTDSWGTVGSSTNIIEASWLALADSLEYWLVKRLEDSKITD